MSIHVQHLDTIAHSVHHEQIYGKIPLVTFNSQLLPMLKQSYLMLFL